ncbi:MAG: hypothetical protein IPG23_13150 [Burkholderiales bacterium]|nr:hypothetical protein [Burkholderiales bacterium]
MNASVDCIAQRSQANVQGVVRVVMGVSGRINIPTMLHRSVPCFLVEISPEIDSNVGQWLAVVDSAGDWPTPAVQFTPHLQVLAESTGDELALPDPVCKKYGLKPGFPIWLIAVGDYLEVWSDIAYQAQEQLAIDAVMTPALANPTHHS